MIKSQKNKITAMERYRELRSAKEVDSLLESLMRETLRRYPVLSPYREILKFGYLDFFKQGGFIFFDEHAKGSLVHPYMFGPHYVLDLQIGIKDRVKPITICWSVLHEGGHLLQSRITDEIHDSAELTLERETDAWDRAEKKLAEFKVSAEDLRSFKDFRESCLQTYRDKIMAK